MKRVHDLIGQELDFWAAMAAGLELEAYAGGWRVWGMHAEYGKYLCGFIPGLESTGRRVWMDTFSPSNDYKVGGPLMEMHKIDTCFDEKRGLWYVPIWICSDEVDYADYESTSQLVTAMRCLVADKYGDTVPAVAP